jgi:hypothetical protein
MRQLEFQFMQGLLTIREQMAILVEEESRKEFDRCFLEHINKL